MRGARWIAMLAFARASAAAPMTQQVRWTRDAGAEACIEERAVLAGVEQRLGRPIGDATAPRMIEGRVEKTGDGYRVRIVTLDEHGVALGERELLEPSADCRKLDDKVTLVIALAIDPDAVARRSVVAAAEPARSPSVETPPVASTSRVASTATSVAPSREPWRIALGVSGSTALGVLPGVGVGGRLSVTVDPPRVPALAIAATAWLPDRETVAAGGSRFTLLGGSVALCPRLNGRGRLGVHLCGGIEVDRMRAEGFEFTVNERQTEWIVDVTGEVVATLRLADRWSIEAGIGAWVPVSKPRFVYTAGPAMPTLFQPPDIAAVSRLGVRLEL